MKYYRHKNHQEVICYVIDNEAFFGKWIWKNNICSENITSKNISDDFYNTFEENDSEIYHKIWGNILSKA